MLPEWFNARRATEIGISLADHFASCGVTIPSEISRGRKAPAQKPADALRDFLQRAQREVSAVPLNFYKKAKLANAFKWRLLEKGVAQTTASEVTQTLVMHLSMSRLTTVPGEEPAAPSAQMPSSRRRAARLLSEADQYMARNAYAEAISTYQR